MEALSPHQKEELESLLLRLSSTDLPEINQTLIAPEISEISQGEFSDLLCKSFQTRGSLPVICDVRSEKEFEQDGIPGSFSLPILNNRERHEVGLLYKRHSHKLALQYAFYLAREKEDAFLKKAAEYAKMAGDEPLILFCFRGGGRSHYVAGLLERNGFSVKRLQGGQKAFRKEVQKFLYQGDFELWPLSGKTGCGKSEALETLSEKYPEIPVLHLEAAAGHAASVFGHIRFAFMGVSAPRSQKMFENYLYLSLLRYRKPDGSFPPFFTEMESRKIGSVQVPPALYKALGKGPHIRLEASMDLRVKRLQREYFLEMGNDIHGVGEALDYLKRRIGGDIVRRWQALVRAGNTAEFLREILENYYDKNYMPEKEEPLCTFQSDSMEALAGLLTKFWRLHSHGFGEKKILPLQGE
ncbi:tRNA 2-selenouridine(34) synthase MnmH [Desulfococcaceae bacterium OttesenSCG-928-F15]|nr:tRNA 2-selenouridine(34) synthase MnmH [Desulfococcaceae bacterium OttesenSCG-928-F15]